MYIPHVVSFNCRLARVPKDNFLLLGGLFQVKIRWRGKAVATPPTLRWDSSEVRQHCQIFRFRQSSCLLFWDILGLGCVNPSFKHSVAVRFRVQYMENQANLAFFCWEDVVGTLDRWRGSSQQQRLPMASTDLRPACCSRTSPYSCIEIPLVQVSSNC